MPSVNVGLLCIMTGYTVLRPYSYIVPEAVFSQNVVRMQDTLRSRHSCLKRLLVSFCMLYTIRIGLYRTRGNYLVSACLSISKQLCYVRILREVNGSRKPLLASSITSQRRDFTVFKGQTIYSGDEMHLASDKTLRKFFSSSACIPWKWIMCKIPLSFFFQLHHSHVRKLDPPVQNFERAQPSRRQPATLRLRGQRSRSNRRGGSTSREVAKEVKRKSLLCFQQTKHNLLWSRL